MLRTRSGVTLIELLTVIVIIGILAAIALPHFRGTRDRAYLTALQSDLRSCASQQEIFHDNHQVYAGTVGQLAAFHVSQGVTLQITSANAEGWSAVARHAALGPVQCGLFYGKASAADASPATRPGVLACN